MSHSRSPGACCVYTQGYLLFPISVDPTQRPELVVILVHGTFAQGAHWINCGPLCQKLLDRFASAVDSFMNFVPLAFLSFSRHIQQLPIPSMRRIERGRAFLDTFIYRPRLRPPTAADYPALPLAT